MVAADVRRRTKSYARRESATTAQQLTAHQSSAHYKLIFTILDLGQYLSGVPYHTLSMKRLNSLWETGNWSGGVVECWAAYGPMVACCPFEHATRHGSCHPLSSNIHPRSAFAAVRRLWPLIFDKIENPIKMICHPFAAWRNPLPC